MTKHFSAFASTVLFFIVIEILLKPITNYDLPYAVQDRKRISWFMEQNDTPRILAIGSSRTRAFYPLEESSRIEGFRALAISGGGCSTLNYFVLNNLTRKFEKANEWPMELWIILQPRDLGTTDNRNIPSILWRWRDFINNLHDGIDQKEKNFLLYRAYSCFSWSTLFLDRNYGTAFTQVLRRLGISKKPPPSGEHFSGKGEQQIRAGADNLDERERQSLLSLIRYLHDHSCSVRMITMPFGPIVESRLKGSGIEEYFDVISNVAVASGVHAMFLGSQDIGLKDEDFGQDATHLRDKGKKKFCDYICSTIPLL